MDSNTHSTRSPGPQPGAPPDGLARLVAAVDGLATQDLDGLSAGVRAERLLDRQEGLWLKELAAVDVRGAAGPGGVSAAGL